eukprot:2223560-Amphidinium_carterae.2
MLRHGKQGCTSKSLWFQHPSLRSVTRGPYAPGVAKFIAVRLTVALGQAHTSEKSNHKRAKEHSRSDGMA